jgi:lambda family phage portal protein
MKLTLEVSGRSPSTVPAQPGLVTGGAALVSPVVNPDHAGKVRHAQSVSRGRIRMYEAAQTTKLTSDFGVSIASSNAQVLNSRIAATSRARTLERDNPYAWRAIQLFQNNVAGSAPFKLEVKLGKKDKDGKFTKDDEANAKVKLAWKRAGRKENCTVRRDMTRNELYWQAISAMVRDGGMMWRKYTGFANRFGFAVDPVEIDRLDHWWNRPAVGTANEIQFGIERDQFRAPVAYHILTRHPGDVYAYSRSVRYREEVPASDIIHFQDIRTRGGQDIAMPRFSSVITGMHRLDQYDIAECSAAIGAACYAGFLVRKQQQGTEFQGDTQTEEGEKEITVEPGVLMELDSNQDFKAWDPKHPVEAYSDFTNQNIRRIAVGLGLSHFSLSENYEGISYSSGRLSLLENRREFRKLQDHFCENAVRPHYEAWLKYALLSGEVDLPMSMYAEICEASEFIPIRWEWIDPLKDGQANIMNIEAGLDSRQRVIAESERGDDFHQVCIEQEEDETTAEKHGLDFNAPATTPALAKGPVEQDNKEATATPGKKKGLLPLSPRTRNLMSELAEAGNDDTKIDAALLNARRNGKEHHV